MQDTEDFEAPTQPPNGGLSHEIWQLIVSFLDDRDLLAISTVSKAFAEDVRVVGELTRGKKFSTHLHEQASQAYQPPFGSVRFLERCLDSLACLFWLGDKTSICVATALVAIPSRSKAKPKATLLITANSPAPKLSKGLEQGDTTWIIKDQTKVTSGFQKEAEAWLETTRLATLERACKVDGQLTREAFLALNAASLKDVNPFFKVESRFGRAGLGNRYCHAEMKIVDLLWSGAVLPVDQQALDPGAPPSGVPVVYIGVNLLCCQHCFKAVQAFNACSTTCKIAVRGTHGVGYKPLSVTGKNTESGWIPPAFLAAGGDIGRAFLAQYEGGGEGYRATVDGGGKSAIRPASFEEKKK
jgi:hypothetical protein